MTKDEALTMIIASIAMEELALSHIVNAEGEKLQYILGTLPGKQGSCASPQEILAVNKSATELLNTVMQNQMLLKGKLEKALEAGCPPTCGGVRPPEPPPCGGVRPPEPPSCGGVRPPEPPSCSGVRPPEPPSCSGVRPPEPPPCGGVRPPEPPPCGGGCPPGSIIQLTSRCSGFFWISGHLLSWKHQDRRGRSISWDEKTPAQVMLEPGKAYALDYTINVRGPFPGDGRGAVLTKLTPCDAFSGVLPLYFSGKGLEREPLTLHYSTVLFPQACTQRDAGLSLLLSCAGSLFVEQAVLNITQLS